MYTLIITSTVYINSNKTLLIDPEQRLKQYIESILFYMNCEMIKDIVVCDNSNYDYSTCKEFLNKTPKKNIEFLHFSGDTEQTMLKGKGYGEGQIMAYIMDKSKLIRTAESFCKITGRLLILNIDVILKKIKRNNNYFQRTALNPFTVTKKVDTRFYHCKTDIFKQVLLNSFSLVDDNNGYYLEHVYYNELNANGIPYYNFNRLPNVAGFSGSTGEKYDIKKTRWFFLKNIYKVLNFANIRS